jgi:hypothetical protein
MGMVSWHNACDKHDSGDGWQHSVVLSHSKKCVDETLCPIHNASPVFATETVADARRPLKPWEWGGVFSDTTIVTGMIDILPAMKVPKQYPLVLLVKIGYRSESVGKFSVLWLGSRRFFKLLVLLN